MDLGLTFYCRAIAAILASLFAAALLGWLLQPAKPKLRGDEGYQALPASYGGYHPECRPEALVIMRRRERERQAALCADGEERRREAAGSLLEYRRQADAANESVKLIWKQTGIAAWELIIGSLTLFAAAAAAWYAKQASESARRALDHAKNVSGLQLRPNVHIETVDLVEGSGSSKVTFGIRNSGTVLARDLRVTGGWGYREDVNLVPLNLSKCRAPKQIAYGTGLVIEVPPSDGSTLAREGNLNCQFEVFWKDEAGLSHRIGEIHRFDGEEFRFSIDTQPQEHTQE